MFAGCFVFWLCASSCLGRWLAQKANPGEMHPRPVYQSMDLSIHLYSITASSCIIACNSQIILPPSCLLFFCYVWNPILSYVNAHPLILTVFASSECYNVIWFAFALRDEQDGWWGLHRIPKVHDIIEVRHNCQACVSINAYTRSHILLRGKRVQWVVTRRRRLFVDQSCDIDGTRKVSSCGGSTLHLLFTFK